MQYAVCCMQNSDRRETNGALKGAPFQFCRLLTAYCSRLAQHRRIADNSLHRLAELVDLLERRVDVRRHADALARIVANRRREDAVLAPQVRSDLAGVEARDPDVRESSGHRRVVAREELHS